MSNYKIETKCIQSGYEPGNGEPRILPIYQSTTFRYTSSEQMGRLFDLEESGYFYTRLQNPTNDAVAEKICDLEGGVAAMLTSSGQAANFYAIMNIAQAGDHIVCASALYGGTYNLYAHTIKKMGVEATFVDPDCTPEELDAAFKDNTKAVFGETIANPALVVLDFEKFDGPAEISVTFVDNRRIQELNKQYRDKDAATDVLSFPMGENGEYDIDEDNGCKILGDIVISMERAMEQAELYGHSLQREVAYLTVHSMLHLLGYDHEASGLEAVHMREKEEAVLIKLGLPRTVSYTSDEI